MYISKSWPDMLIGGVLILLFLARISLCLIIGDCKEWGTYSGCKDFPGGSFKGMKRAFGN